jgi:hypothetical protein
LKEKGKGEFHTFLPAASSALHSLPISREASSIFIFFISPEAKRSTEKRM